MPSQSGSRLRALADLADELELDAEALASVIGSVEALEGLQALLAQASEALGPDAVISVPEAALDATELLLDPVLLHQVLRAVEELLKGRRLLDERAAKRAHADMQRLVADWLLALPRVRNQATLQEMLQLLEERQRERPGLQLAA